MPLTFPWIFQARKARILKLRFKGSHDHGKTQILNYYFFLHLLNTQSICIKKSCNIYPMIHRSLDFGTDTRVTISVDLPSGHGYCPMLINHKMMNVANYYIAHYILWEAIFNTHSPIFCKSPPLPVYSVRHPFHIEAYLARHTNISKLK